MASYLLKIKRWLGRGLMVAIIGLVISFLPIIANVLFENEIENLLYILNINIRTITSGLSSKSTKTK